MPSTAPLDERPFVSVIIPCRNEGGYIAECLQSLRQGSWPSSHLEVLVVDGRSDDDTVAVVERLAAEWPVVRVLDNPQQYVPTALNTGIREAKGSVIVRMDAHSTYPPDYVEVLVGRLLESGADNVGGVCHTVPGSDTATARGIAAALSNRLAVGNAHYRVGATQECWVDTVPFGCFRRDVFDRVGLFDVDMIRNQDDEFNHRLLKSGGRILLVPSVVITYFARATFSKLARMMYQYGLFKPLAAKKVGRVTTVRQLAPASLVSCTVLLAVAGVWTTWAWVLLSGIWCTYLLLLLAAGWQQVRRSTWREAVAMMAAIPLIHCAYGAGYLRGLARLFRRRSPANVPRLTSSR